MGNIITTHIALFPKLDSELKHLTISELTTQLLSLYFGRTYSASPYYFSYGANWMYDISFCEKWSPSGILKLMSESGDLFDKVFVRFIDDMGDYDRIFSLPNKDFKSSNENSKECTYLFDKILFKEYEGMPGFSKSTKKINSGYLEVEISGNFQARNELPMEMLNGINTYLIETSDRISTFPSSEVNSDDNDTLNSILENSDDISFLYKEHTVERRMSPDLIRSSATGKGRVNMFFANRDKQKIKYSSCGWLNCGDDDYQLYILKRNVDYLDYIERQKRKS